MRLLTPRAAIGCRKRRYGSQGDGGHVMLDALRGLRHAFSFGTGREVSWDQAIAECGLLVHRFDHAADRPPLVHPNFRFQARRIVAEEGDGGETLAGLLAGIPHDAEGPDLILKIDVEGEEWPILDMARGADLKRFSQIVCEFHDLHRFAVDAWFERAIRVAERLHGMFQPVHVHGNNMAGVVVGGGWQLPSVLEVTYANRSAFSFSSHREWMPTALDYPNVSARPEIILGWFGRSVAAPSDEARQPARETSPRPVPEHIRSWLTERHPASQPSAPATPLSDDVIDWMATIERAGRDFALPTLASLIEAAALSDQLPRDVGDYLDFALTQNAEANSLIRAQCLDIGRALHRIGKSAALLKGAAWLFEDGPSAHDRMMRDIDLLVEPGAAAAVHEALAGLGYRRADMVVPIAGHFHDHPLVHPGHSVMVEVHTELTAFPRLLSAGEVLADALPVTLGLRLPSIQHRLLHNVIHSEICNGGHVSGIIDLRDATDLARLIQVANGTIDWTALHRDAETRGYGDILSGAVLKAAHLSGQAPPAFFRDDPRGRRHLRRCLWQLRHPAADRLIRRFGLLHRALAWDRDAHPLGLGDRRDVMAHLAVTRRRVGRAWRAAHARFG